VDTLGTVGTDRARVLRVVRSRETRELLMKNLSYGSSAMLVSDDTAAAVLHYTAVLAMTRSADVVEVPTIDAHGPPLTSSSGRASR
jgi:hypothetical protein